MLNLFGRVSQTAEEALAEALEHHHHLTKLSFPQASLRGKDLVRRYLSRNEKARRDAKGWSRAPDATGGLWDADWRPEINSASPAVVVTKGASGKHVGAAREKWDSFIDSEQGAVEMEEGAIFETEQGWSRSGAAPRASVLYEPTALPELDLPTGAKVGSRPQMRPFDPSNAGDVARAAEEQARAEAMDGSVSEVDALSLGNAVVAAAAKKQEKIVLAVATLEGQREAAKREEMSRNLDEPGLSSKNPLANEVVLAAREHKAEIKVRRGFEPRAASSATSKCHIGRCRIVGVRANHLHATRDPFAWPRER